MPMKKKWWLIALIVLFAAVAAYSALRLYRIYSGYRESESVYQSLTQYLTEAEPTEAPTSPATQPGQAPEQTQQTQQPSERAWPAVDFAALREINPDIVAWILCEGTDISYPVVRGSNNDYYLTHLFDGTYNSAGCVFMDYRCSSDFSDISTVLYGHHMKDGSMFSAITSYQTQEYYAAHPELLLLTPSGNYVLEVFSGYVTDVDSNAWQRSFATEQDYARWLSETLALSCFDSDTVPTVDDRIVTLSTCTYEFENARFVLVCVLK